MNYQNEKLPPNVVKVGSTDPMDETNILSGLLKNHATSSGKFGYLVVQAGSLQFVWEDNNEIFDSDSSHPIVIFPERVHHVQLIGKVRFHIEFYKLK